VIFYGGNRSAWANEAFPDKEGETHSFQEGLLSRKQQILPKLTNIINMYS
jgi:manganese-dependent inorganic pyrophosphatase